MCIGKELMKKVECNVLRCSELHTYNTHTKSLYFSQDFPLNTFLCNVQDILECSHVFLFALKHDKVNEMRKWKHTETNEIVRIT